MTIRPEFKKIADKMIQICETRSYFAPLEIQNLSNTSLFENSEDQKELFRILTRLWIEETIQDQDTASNANVILHEGIDFLFNHFSSDEVTYLANGLSELYYLLETRAEFDKK